MPKLPYKRDLPDGTRLYFSSPPERPDGTQRYFDDMLWNTWETEPNEPLSFLIFGKEQSYPHRVLHRTSEDYILHYVTQGCGVFNGRTVRAGEGFLVVPDVVHHMESDREDPWHFKWISFRGSDIKSQMKQIGLDAENPYFSFDFSEKLETLFDDVIYGEHGDCDLNTYMQGIFYIILSYHKRAYRNILASSDKRRYVASAIRYMDAHFREDLRVDQVADALHISRKYLCALLSREIGMSTKEYLLHKRARAAAELLRRTEMTVSEIGREIGYDDYTQFSRMFRKQMGLSPQQYRKRGNADRS